MTTVKRERTRAAKERLDKIIGKNILIQRKLRKIRRDDFAKLLDMTPSHLGLIERGERGATAVTLERIAKAFGITADSLFDEGGKGIKEEDRGKGVYYKKVSTLITNLSDPELIIVSHAIAGILGARDTADTK